MAEPAAPQALEPTVDELLTQREVAGILRVSVQTVRVLGDRDELPFVRVGRQRRIRRSALDAFLRGGSEASRAS